jgi:hypothetical protein
VVTYKFNFSVRQTPRDLKRRERAGFMSILSLAVQGTLQRDVESGGECVKRAAIFGHGEARYCSGADAFAAENIIAQNINYLTASRVVTTN